MNLSQLAKVLHQYNSGTCPSSEFLNVMLDMIINVNDQDENREYNPLYKLSDNTRRAIFNGSRNLARTAAAQVQINMDEQYFASNIEETYSYDALASLSEAMQAYGFDAHPDNVAAICANVLAQLITLLAAGKKADVFSVTIKAKEKGRRVRDIPPAAIEYRDGKLYVSGESIQLPPVADWQHVNLEELPYVTELCAAYAEAEQKQVLGLKEIEMLPRMYREHFQEQNIAFFTAEALQRRVRDVFDDGEAEFTRLKEDAWHGINMTYWKKYDNGFERLNAVLEKITSTSLEASFPSRIRNLMSNLTKKGVCHVLVNDGVIKSWVWEKDDVI